ncbi:hypothetical protein MKX01_034062 [Papaver californicum]|nr:hypothetical protein MKX01_034062 [Papaver californicum]
MVNNKAILQLVLYVIVFFLIFNSHECEFRSFQIQNNNNPNQKISTAAEANACSYTVAVKTSCSSTRFTRDQISLAFGDAFGNKLDDPSLRAFERCSVNTYYLSGPCTYRIYHMYLYRVGSDG